MVSYSAAIGHFIPCLFFTSVHVQLTCGTLTKEVISRKTSMKLVANYTPIEYGAIIYTMTGEKIK